jgi:ABC-type nitrate/sulfonate/bicarbonate transport system substrate-binding protein
MLKRHLLAISLVVALAATGCGGDAGDSDGTGAEGERYSIKMGMVSATSTEFFAWRVAEIMGYYDDLNLEVEFVNTDGSGDGVEQLIAGNLDVANPSASAAAEAALSGLDVTAYYTYSTGAIFGIFTPADSGISSIADLKGKNIGITEAGGGEVAFLNAALKEEGVDPVTGVTVIPIGAGDATTLQAISDGRVDAYAAGYNDVFALRVTGEVELNDLTPADQSNYPGRWMLTRPEVIDEKEEALKRFARATSMGIHFCVSDWEACEQILRDWIPEVWEENAAGLSQGEQRFELAQEGVTPDDPDRYGAFDRENVQDFFDTIETATENPQEVNLDDFIDDSMLDYANDFDRAKVEEDAANYKG